MSEIVLENISKTFETKDGTVEALKNVSLTIDKGEIYGVIGMSGAGKSTLVRCINFLEKPDEGRVLIEGKSLDDFSKKELQKQRESIGMIFQHFNLLMQKTVLENVCFPLYIQKVSKKEARKKALELLELVGLVERKNAYPAQLSGGQKQRVAIARALASDPKILLCDEATSALDNITQKKVSEALDKLKCTRIIIAHRLSTIMQCDRIIVLKNGQIAEDGTYSQLTESDGLFAELVRRQRLDK